MTGMQIVRRGVLGAALMVAAMQSAGAQTANSAPTSLVSVYTGVDVLGERGLNSKGPFIELRDEGLLKKKRTGFKLMAGLRYHNEKYDDGGKMNLYLLDAGVGYDFAFFEEKLRVMPLALMGTTIAWYDLPPTFPSNRSENVYNPMGHYGVDVGYRVRPTVELSAGVRRYWMAMRSANSPFFDVHTMPNYNLGVRVLLGTRK